jgi:probable HAF family extracellular repeat protein
VIQNAMPNDFAPANQGQLKNIAKAAAAEMDAHLPGGAGEIVHALIASWSPPTSQTNDLAPLNLGQLKKVAKPFYDRLIATDYVTNYPWVNATNAHDDFAVANIGQVKKLFSFDLRAVDATHDTDQNGLPDWWERFYFGTIGNNPNAPAARGDGRTILQAFEQSLNPNDFYDGALPLLQKTGGDGQTGRTNEVLLQSLHIRVTDSSGATLANAPVTFSGDASGTTLAAFASGPFSANFTTNTNQLGIASARVRLPGITGTVNIAATVTSGSNTVTATFVATATAPVNQIAPPPYEVRILPPNAPKTIITFESNSNGLIAGAGTDSAQSETGYPPRRSFLWNPVTGSYTELGFLPGSTSTEALGLNDLGDVIGDANDANGNDQGFIWRNGTLQAIVAPGAAYTYPYAINNAGEVVGTSYDANGLMRGFVWNNGVFTMIDVPNSNGTSVEDINASGQVLGYYYDENWNEQGFLWQNGAITYISVPGAMSVSARFFNDAGQVAGEYRGSNFWFYGFFWENGVATTITLGGFRTTVYGMNAAGQVIGSSALPGTSLERAFVWQNGQITQLISLPGAQTGQSSRATSINDGGAIMGTSAAPTGSGALALWQDGRVWKVTDCVPAYLHPDATTYFDIHNTYDITGRRLVLHRLPDSDGDGLPDAWETQYGLNPNSAPDAAVDTDGDGLTNYQEYHAGSNPTSADTDADGVPDGWEAAHGYDPRVAGDAQLDEDNDGLTTAQEYQNETEPRGAYTVTDVRNSNSVWVFPSALNAAGQVIGTRGDSTGSIRGYFWHDSAMEDITPPGAGSIELFSLNDLGQTIGRYRDGANVLHNFVWAAGAATDLPFPTLYQTSAPFLRPQINNQGQIMGTYVDANQKPHGFLWHDSALQDIAPTAPWSYVLSLNNSGAVLGATFDANGTGHGFVWQDGVMTALPQYPDRGALNDAGDAAIGYRDLATSIPRIATAINGTFSPLGTAYVGELVSGRAINAAGHVLVRNGTPPGVWRNGQVTQVSALNGLWIWPQAFNDSDVVVGESTTPDGATHAFVSRDGHTTDLRYLVPQDSGLEFISAIAINNSGQILIKAVANGWNHAVLLTPNNDSDSNGLPDDWEKFYFGQAGADPNGDADGDGVTNAQEYANRTNPTDYYNGLAPVLSIVSGDNQQSGAGAFTPLPLVVKIADSTGNPLPNAPVSFTVTDGGGGVAQTPQGTGTASQATRTAADGTTGVFYFQPGTANVTSHITVSAGGQGATATVVFAAISTEGITGSGLVVTPAAITQVVNPGTSVTVPLIIRNDTYDTQEITAGVSLINRPSFTDSRQENGPTFVWNDISATGTHLAAVSNYDEGWEGFEIGFEFPFFGENYHTVYASSNGYITFGAGSLRFNSRPLPSTLMAPNLVAALAGDLNLRASGDVYYLEQPDGVVIQYNNAAPYNTQGSMTFQIVLKRDGTILFYYKDMIGPLEQWTVGVQNEARDVGLTVASNTAYLESNLAVRIIDTQKHQLVTTAPQGTIYNGSYTDSDQPDGPTYVWDDISATGTRLNNLSDADDSSESFNISFPFPFFERIYQTVWVGSNGYVTFGSGASTGFNLPLPTWVVERPMIAGLFSDLDTSASGDIYYEEKPDKVIIQFNNVARYDGDGFATFQIVLQPDGNILLYYKELIGNGYRATVGLQGSTQVGMTVAHNQPYLKNNFAVRLDQLSHWLTVSPETATLAPGASTTVNALLDARFIRGGNYDATIHVASSATPEMAVDVPVSMRINVGPEVMITGPTSGARYVEDDSIVFEADAQDIDGIGKVEFFDGTTQIGEVTTAPFVLPPVVLPVGYHTITARATDALGMSTTSDPIGIEVQADADHDGLLDWWEIDYFGTLALGPNDDPDGDGLTNLEEFQGYHDPTYFDDMDGDGLGDGQEIHQYHTDPAVADTDGDGMPDGYEVAHGFNPLQDDRSGDPDADGLTNGEEFSLGTDPLKFSTVEDGISDGWKVAYGLDPLDPTLANQVLPGIGKTVRETYDLGIDPIVWDSNGDGVADRISASLGIDPLSLDNDGDGISNAAELVAGTNPFKADTDGDGVADGLDAFPLDPTRSQLPTDPNDTTAPGITLFEPVGATPVP